MVVEEEEEEAMVEVREAKNLLVSFANTFTNISLFLLTIINNNII